jgi:hypothetical protein
MPTAPSSLAAAGYNFRRLIRNPTAIALLIGGARIETASRAITQ